MSEQDQIQLVGRLTLEAAALRRRVAFIREELEQVVKAFEVLLNTLRPRATSAGYRQPGSATMKLEGYASKYSDLSKLMDLVKEQDEAEKQLAELNAKLADLGV